MYLLLDVNLDFISVYSINERHALLTRTIGTHPLEDDSYEMANYLNKVASISLITFLILEIVFYNVYNTMVT